MNCNNNLISQANNTWHSDSESNGRRSFTISWLSWSGSPRSYLIAQTWPKCRVRVLQHRRSPKHTSKCTWTQSISKNSTLWSRKVQNTIILQWNSHQAMMSSDISIEGYFSAFISRKYLNWELKNEINEMKLMKWN